MRTIWIAILILCACSTSATNDVTVIDDLAKLDQSARPSDTRSHDLELLRTSDMAPDATGVVIDWPTSPVAASELPGTLPAATEGLAFDADGTLYLGTTKGTVLKIAPGSQWVEWAQLLPLPDGAIEGTAGLAIGPDNALYVCRYDASRIERVALDDPMDATVFLEIETPNSLVFRDKGDLWFTSSGGHSDWDGHIGRLKAGATLPEVMVNHVTYANGLAFAPDESALFVTSSDPGTLWRIPLDGAGNPGEAEVLAEGPEMAIADGLTIAPDGTLLIAGFGTGTIYAWLEGQIVPMVAAPEGANYFGTASLSFAPLAPDAPPTLYFTNLLTPVIRTVSF